MAQKDLIPINKRPLEERRAIQAKATAAAKVSREKRKFMKDALKCLLELPAVNSKAKKDLIRRGFDEKQIDNMAILIDSLWRRAAEGNIYAIKEIRNIIGQDDSAALLRIKKQEYKLKEKEFELKKTIYGEGDDALSELKIEIVRASKRVGE